MRLADTGYTPLQLNVQNMEDDITISEEDLNTWRMQTLHGKFLNSLQEKHVDEDSSTLWLSAGCIYIYTETEGFAVAIQDWVIKTRTNEGHCF